MIFERFSQIDGGTERRFGGTGLGLAIVKEFAQLQGGNVSVSETPGGGAFFTVTLPLTAPDGAVIHGAEGEIDETFERMIPAGESRQIAGKENVVSSDAPLILVVEDNPDMNRYITSLLGGLYRVVTVFDGAEGLASAQTLRPDLVISDIMMLRMSGERMIQALLDRPEMDNLPIIILSAKADDDLRVRLLKNGVREYLTKPFSDAELLARVAGLLAHQSRTKEELRKSEERLRLALDATSDALWDWDLGSGIIYRSPHYYELTGRQPGEDANDFEFFKSTVQPEDLHRVLKTIEAHKQGKTAAIEFDYRLAAKNGNLKWMRIRGRAVERDASGAPVRIVGTLSDITEHKLAEEEIRELNANLEQRVEERTAELAAANRELDAFAYAVSHDLRAPLRGMSGFSQALIEDYGEQLSGEARIYLEQITIASQRMGELIDGLLILSRGTRGELRRDLLDLSQISERIRDDLIHHEPERQVAWRIEPGMRVRGDARMLKVVMSNLIGNAWKYTAGSLSPLISIYTEEYEGTRRYCVSDNGAGFDMAHASRLFKPFQRLHRQDEFPGIGIGLATVQRIIHAMGEKSLPREYPEKEPHFALCLLNSYHEEETMAGIKTILLLEDNPRDEILVPHPLRKVNLANQVDVTRNGQQALDYPFREGEHAGRTGQELPAVVPLDINMPRINDLKVPERLRGDQYTRMPPVVIPTSSDEERGRLKSYERGASGFVRKPLDFAEFAEAVPRLGVYWMAVKTPPKG